ncbi:tafazzin-like isoform X2 [Eurytemora carolleeae]|uniref:tafazzin-like isoform X2 n=1 Tax=Eurytemora carolleeae TaxID=1294199 RepID=UPI000C794635|nr:tafazzin-like isoform X2 [Eurytemora carolleeae]|eukprot:XP_023323102.1 tafazzin-like isoform X2 [Eurytemora affinis]
MEDLIDKLSKKYPDQTPIRVSRYVPNCLIGRTKVWKDEKETITATDTLYPAGSIQEYIRAPGYNENSTIKSRLYREVSRMTMFIFGMGAKFLLSGINTTLVHGAQNLQNVLSRPVHVPLLSYFNHNSCFDDPGLMGAILSPAQLADVKGMRWSVSATEIIFLNRPLSMFWSLGKVVPGVRGWGPRQPAIDFLINRLNEGSWVNIFPEAKVVESHSQERFKWGIGRLVAEAKLCPIILPVYHLGMNRVLPNPGPGESQPFVIRPGNLVTVCIGEPIDLTSLREQLREEKEEYVWSRITRELQDVMKDLEKRTRTLHTQNILNWVRRWHDAREM